MSKKRSRRLKWFLRRVVPLGGAAFVIVSGVLWQVAWTKPERVLSFSGMPKRVALVEDGQEVVYPRVLVGTVGDFLKVYHIDVREGDALYADPADQLYGGDRIYLNRAKKITLTVGEETKDVVTTAANTRDLLWEENIEKREDDFVLPGEDAPLEDGMDVELVRVDIKEEKDEVDIPYETVVTEDDKMGWREKKVTQKGDVGTKEKVYKAVYHNGELIKRTLLDEHVLTEPVTEKVIQGTYVKLGKGHSGQGTWYAYTGTLAAASPWLPLGSYAKVTNTANGESVIVKINDRGPFGTNRIIDLDKVAFQKIASLGAGVINVRVEEVLN